MHEVDRPRTGPLDHLDAVAADDGNPGDPRALQCLDLTLEQRPVADAREALGAITDDALKAAATARGEDDGPHSVSSAGRSRVMWSICATLPR